MKNFSFELLSILLIISILFIFVPAQQAKAGIVVTLLGATEVIAVWDFVSCWLNIVFWGGCGNGGGGGGGGGGGCWVEP